MIITRPQHDNNRQSSARSKRHVMLSVALTGVLAFLGACGTGGGYNPTTYQYYVDKQKLAQQPLKKVVLVKMSASGLPTRSILREGQNKMYGMVSSYLRGNGYSLVPYYRFENAWNKAILTYGEFYDPTTGRVDTRTWQQAMAATLADLKKQGGVDGLVFADVIEHDIQHSGGQQHYARWYGVTRKPSTQGTGSGVPVDFNWLQSIKGASLVVTVYNVDGAPVFSSRGGMETLHAVDLRSSKGNFVRRKKILKNTSQMREGMEIAFHPLIPMKKYPGRKKK